ncbi:hypothetical protein D1872_37750 [compost metagenome]
MATLTSKQRNDIPETLFGLPNERKFPLTDESHVRKAIQYFKYCQKGKQAELAKRINKRMKELNMNINVSKDSAFYSYAPKQITKEGLFNISELRDAGEHVENDISNETRDRIKQLEKQLNISFQSAQVQFNNFTDFSSLNQIEKSIHDNLISKVYHTVDYGFNPVEEINNCLQNYYDSLWAYASYDNVCQTDDIRSIMAIIRDITDSIICMIRTPEDRAEQVQQACNVLYHIPGNITGMLYMVRRMFRQVIFEWWIHERLLKSEQRIDDERPRLDAIRHIIHDTLESLNDYKSEVSDRMLGTFVKIALSTSNVNYHNYAEFLRSKAKQIDSELYIMKSNNLTNTDYHVSESIQEGDVIPNEIKGCLDQLSGRIDPDNITWLDRNLSIQLDERDLLMIRKSREVEQLYIGQDVNGNKVYYDIATKHTSKSNLYLIVTDRSKYNTYYFIRLVKDGEIQPGIQNLYCAANQFDTSLKMKAILFTVGAKDEQDWDLDSEVLTEGIAFDEHGNIKFSFSPKKSLMDEYAENHALLLQNVKAENYTGMKTNLAFLFALINHIERNIIHGKKKLSEEKKEHAMKARMFATNDFKTYMKVLLKAEPSFDFMTYYQSGDYGKVNFHISQNDIMGVKRLFYAIMFK